MGLLFKRKSRETINRIRNRRDFPRSGFSRQSEPAENEAAVPERLRGPGPLPLAHSSMTERECSQRSQWPVRAASSAASIIPLPSRIHRKPGGSESIANAIQRTKPDSLDTGPDPEDH